MAEIRHLLQDKEAFYKELEKAVIKGFELASFADTDPYLLYKNESRFRALLDKSQLRN